MLNTIDLQDFIYEKNPSRMDLLNYKNVKTKHQFKIFVYRNHSFELIENTINAYLDYSNMSAEFEYSDYDDSLSFVNINDDADLIILWLDLSRYNTNNLSDFFNSRIKYLKTMYKKPIIFAPISGQVEINEIGILNIDFSLISKDLGDKFLDIRMREYTGTNLSNQACLMISKELGLKYLPPLLLTNLKAIAVDLDNTLYKGVLGEDGYDGIELTSGHIELQKTLKKLLNSGFFVCIVSKNDLSDVEKLFSSRNDLPLKFSDFTKTYISWENKDFSIKKMAQDLNIHPDSILFIDDNIGEVSSVYNTFPEIKFILAKEDANITNKVLESYPGLFKINYSFEDSIRTKDIQANTARVLAQSTMSKEDYINSLDMELTYSIDNLSFVDRIVELANKTNQFIFSYKRYSKTQIEELIKDKNYCVITISLKDRLSDSGIVGVLVVKKEAETAFLEELFISCRSLGRGIDEIIIFKAIEICLKKLVCDKLKINFIRGERNEPAYNFVEKNLAKYLNKCLKYQPYGWNTKIHIKEIIS